jgi:putative transposase
MLWLCRQRLIKFDRWILASHCPPKGYYGSEFISHELIDWAIKEQITLLYIQPRKPTQNAYVERFNRTAQHELLALNLFEGVEHAQLSATQWQWTYNNIGPHSAIGGVPPRQLL